MKISQLRISSLSKRKEKVKKNEQSPRNWDTTKCINICIMGVLEGGKREKGAERIFEDIMTKNFSNLMNTTTLQIQEVQKTPSTINLRQSIPRYIIVKLMKTRDRES